MLDNGLVDALTTLAERSAIPVELVTDIPERPSAAIETIAYFSAAEMLAGSKVRIIGLPAARIAQLTEGESVAIHAVRPESKRAWMRGAVYDPPAWRARLYFGLKLPLAAIDLLVAVGLRLTGLAYLTYPFWWQFAKAGPWLPGGVHTATQAGSFLLLPAGAVLLLAAPWLTQAVTDADRQLIRGLLGPGSVESAALAERVRDLEVTRAHAVEDSAARLRSIERDLHDGAQAQLPSARRPRSRPSPTSPRPKCSPTWASTAARGTLPSKRCTSPACSGSASPTTASAAPRWCRTAACPGWPNASAPSTAAWTSTARAAAPRW